MIKAIRLFLLSSVALAQPGQVCNVCVTEGIEVSADNLFVDVVVDGLTTNCFNAEVSGLNGDIVDCPAAQSAVVANCNCEVFVPAESFPLCTVCAAEGEILAEEGAFNEILYNGETTTCVKLALNGALGFLPDCPAAQAVFEVGCNSCVEDTGPVCNVCVRDGWEVSLDTISNQVVIAGETTTCLLAEIEAASGDIPDCEAAQAAVAAACQCEDFGDSGTTHTTGSPSVPPVATKTTESPVTPVAAPTESPVAQTTETPSAKTTHSQSPVVSGPAVRGGTSGATKLVAAWSVFYAVTALF